MLHLVESSIKIYWFLARLHFIYVFLLMLLSGYFLVTSAFVITEFVGSLTVVSTIIVFIFSTYGSYLAQKSMIVINRAGEQIFLDRYVPIYFFFVLGGFTQLFFWVIDPETPIHEPRSVFIIGIGATIVYIRQQYLSGSSILAKYQ